jgi:2-polyprenyl-3-methyl-5-hydroxy-6-metoxy-1,4-benzoquinol methylase
MSTQELDQAKLEAFGGQMLGVLNGGFLALLISIGHRTGLFDLLAGMEPATSVEIAEAAGLDERYVRELLGGLVVGGILEYDSEGERFSLPPEHAAFTTRAAGGDNMAFFAQYVGLCGLVEDGVVEAFKKGGGVPYSAYPKFQQIQAEESAQTFDAILIDIVLPLAEGIPERLREGIEVADIGCGQGHAVNLMAQAFPASNFVGFDFSEEGAAAGRAEAAALGLHNARFKVEDVALIGEHDRFDLITAFDVIHDLARPAETLSRIHTALKPDGTFLVVDIQASSKLEENVEHPLGPLLYGASVFHCMTVSLAQGGPGLGTVWGEQKAQEMLRDAGFSSVELKKLEGDFFHAFYVCRK